MRRGVDARSIVPTTGRVDRESSCAYSSSGAETPSAVILPEVRSMETSDEDMETP